MSIAEDFLNEFDPLKNDLSRHCYDRGIEYQTEVMQRHVFSDGSVILEADDLIAIEDDLEKWKMGDQYI